jgi:hypothetical protein
MCADNHQPQKNCMIVDELSLKTLFALIEGRHDFGPDCTRFIARS